MFFVAPPFGVRILVCVDRTEKGHQRMSETVPAVLSESTSYPTVTASPKHDETFWHGLVHEAEAAAFLGLSIRSMQGYRYRSGGPRFVRISARCVRYRRTDLREWAEARIRTSTSDPNPATSVRV